MTFLQWYAEQSIEDTTYYSRSYTEDYIKGLAKKAFEQGHYEGYLACLKDEQVTSTSVHNKAYSPKLSF